MSKLGIRFKPSPGVILDCDFGSQFYKRVSAGGNPVTYAAIDNDPNHVIHPEIHKRRPVIVIGADDALCTVVPISTKEIAKLVAQNIHIPITQIPATDAYAAGTDCWAKCNLVTTVSRGRLSKIPNYQGGVFRGYVQGMASVATLEMVKKGVIKHINATYLIT